MEECRPGFERRKGSGRCIVQNAAGEQYVANEQGTLQLPISPDAVAVARFLASRDGRTQSRGRVLQNTFWFRSLLQIGFNVVKVFLELARPVLMFEKGQPGL